MMATSSHPILHSLRDVDVDDLVAGTGRYAGLQSSVRLTFRALVQAINHQASETAKLREQLEQQNQTYAVSMRTTRTLLEGHVEALQAEFSPKLRGLEARLQDGMARVDGLEQRCLGGGMEHSSSTATATMMHTQYQQLQQRLDTMQSEVHRVSRALDSKADNEEVEAAFRLRVTKASLPKRMQAILQQQHDVHNTNNARGSNAAYEGQLQRLKARIETYERKHADQDETVRRMLKEMEAVKTHVLGSSRDGNGVDSISSLMKQLQSMLQQQGRRLYRAEKEVRELHDRAIKEHSALEAKLEERWRAHQQEQARANDASIDEHIKALEQDVVKELDQRDADMRRQLEETLGVFHTIEAKVQTEETRLLERLDKAENVAAFQRVQVLQRVERVEQQVAEATRPPVPPSTPDPTRSNHNVRHPLAGGPSLAPSRTSALPPRPSTPSRETSPSASPPSPPAPASSTLQEQHHFFRQSSQYPPPPPPAPARSLASRGGSMPTDWRGTTDTSSLLGSPRGMHRSRPAGQEELEALRNEKHMLRTRIRAGIMSQSR